MEGKPDLLFEDVHLVFRTIIHNLLAKKDRATGVQTEFILNNWHVNQLDVHDCHDLLFHLLDLIEDIVPMPLYFLANVVKNALCEVRRDEVKSLPIRGSRLTVHLIIELLATACLFAPGRAAQIVLQGAVRFRP